jgi:hypothetical protein
METNAKEVPSKEGVTMRAFLIGAMFITVLTLSTIAVGLKFLIAKNFVSVIGAGVMIVVGASLMSGFVSKEPDPLRFVFNGNLVLISFYAANSEAVLKGKPPDFFSVMFAVLIIYWMFMSLRSMPVALNKTISVLVAQQLLIGAGLYGLYHII